MNTIIWQVLTALLGISLCLAIWFIYKIKKQLSLEINKEAVSRQDLLKYALSNPNPILGVNKKGISIFANHGSESILAQWKVGLNEKIPTEWREVVRQVCMSNEPHTLEMACGSKTYLLCIVPRRDQEATLFGMDITERKELEKELIERSLQDEHTKLPNRISFKQSLEEHTVVAKKDKIKLGVLIVRIDDFFQIVNTYGQEIADHILLEFSQRLSTFSNKKSSLARLSENEFGVLEPQMGDPSVMANYVQSLIEKCTSPYKVAERDVFISISIGIAFCPTDGDSPDILARNAQLAVNRTSSTRKPFEFFQRGMEEQLQLKRETIAELHQAIGKNQLRLHYQPQIHLGSKKLAGCEALIRWRHPEKGEISPFYFITAAEESSLIETIGEWTLREACRQIQVWKQQGKEPIKVAVNVSARQIFNTNIVNLVRDIMNEYQVSNEWLSLELTESALVHDKEKAIAAMNGFKSLGLELALDDFGTGYSSLSYLVQFPIDKIKIDRSFIVIIEDDKKEYAVTKGIIDLGHTMHLKIIAEGVETQSQLNYLQRHQCDIIQGFIFGKALSPDEFTELFNVDWAKEIAKESRSE